MVIMREIKFRGKNIMNVWVYGDLVRDEGKSFIKHKHTAHVIEDIKTIGQYTGLKDKNGVEIYEGDIVQNEEFTLLVIYDSKCTSFILYDRENDRFYDECNDTLRDCDDNEENFNEKKGIFEYNCTSYEVIGNIYKTDVSNSK